MHACRGAGQAQLGRAHADDSFEAAEHVSHMPLRRAGFFKGDVTARLGGFHEIFPNLLSPITKKNKA